MNIGELRERIWDKHQPAFKDFTAHDLSLYKISVRLEASAFDELLGEVISPSEVAGAEILLGPNLISGVFGEALSEDYIQIMVKTPDGMWF
jgi:hypothetical protein